MNTIPLETAKAITSAAIAAALDKGMAGATAVVIDIGGAIRAAERSDKAHQFGIDIATAKARTAVGMGRSTIKLAAVFGDKPSAVAGLNAAVGTFLPLGGGVVVVNADGLVIGGAALAGGAPEVDDAVITGAVEAAGLAVAG